MARMLNYFERTAKIESDKAEKDRKDLASKFLSELASIKQDYIDAYSSATKIASETEEG